MGGGRVRTCSRQAKDRYMHWTYITEHMGILPIWQPSILRIGFHSLGRPAICLNAFGCDVNHAVEEVGAGKVELVARVGAERFRVVVECLDDVIRHYTRTTGGVKHDEFLESLGIFSEASLLEHQLGEGASELICLLVEGGVMGVVPEQLLVRRSCHDACGLGISDGYAELQTR